MNGALRKLRTKAGMSQEELAKRAKVHRITVLNIEGGHETPTIATLTKLARALDVDVAELLKGGSR
jgi:transcriptional regulator with XRE-family HTH domain